VSLIFPHLDNSSKPKSFTLFRCLSIPDFTVGFSQLKGGGPRVLLCFSFLLFLNRCDCNVFPLAVKLFFPARSSNFSSTGKRAGCLWSSSFPRSPSNSAPPRAHGDGLVSARLSKTLLPSPLKFQTYLP